MKPIFLQHDFRKKVWSGDYLKENIGEDWCLNIRDNSSNKIYDSNLSLKDLYLDDSINLKIFGKKFLKNTGFPLLIKYLSVSSKLSVQVHPDDSYAKKYNDFGKMEVWYVIDCEKDAKIAYGLKNIHSKYHLMEILQDCRIENYFNIISLKPGDIVPVYPGTIHAIIGKVFIYEIQQNSDLTFRLYDWNRFDKNRPLHIKESFDVIDLNKKNIVKGKTGFNSEKFSFEVHDIKTKKIINSKKDSCIILNIISGDGVLEIDNINYNLKYLDTILIPSDIKKIIIKGKLKVIESWI